MACKLCSETMEYSKAYNLSGACESCKRQYKQMLSGFRGVVYEPKDKTTHWDNSEAYEEWKQSLADEDTANRVVLKSNDEYTKQRCDIRDMKHVIGLPKFLPLESQVFIAW